MLGIHDGEVTDVVAALQCGAFFQMQVGAGLEEQGASQVGTLRHDDYTALLGGTVDDGLYLFRLEHGAVVHHAVVGQVVGGAQVADIYNFILSEPLGYRRPVGEEILLSEHRQAEEGAYE